VSYLLYCIFGSPLTRTLGIPSGVGGQQVFVVAQNGLSAALSELAESGLNPDVSGILAYEKVVEAFHRHLTVIPVRYGCQLEDASEALCLLERRHDQYATLLHELEGAVEMSIHVLLDGCGAGTQASSRAAPPEFLPVFRNSGAAYLASKRRYYLGWDQAALHQRELVDELCDSLSGLYVRRKVEFPDSITDRLLSLYFLVPRGSLECFRHAARHLASKQSFKLLLSGPWPPYNFVDSLRT
jgi:hypothetical protein